MTNIIMNIVNIMNIHNIRAHFFEGLRINFFKYPL